MNKAELEKKHLSELHLLAAEAGVERYRMLTKGELVDQLAGENGSSAAETPSAERGGEEEREERPRRRRRRRTGSPAVSDEIEKGGEAEEGSEKPEPKDAEREEKPREEEPRVRPERSPEREPAPEPTSRAAESPRPRRRRRRRFGRRGKQGVTLQGLLLPPEAGRQALVFAETREGCTALLRSVAADLSGSDGPDPVALLIDPSPEELADWKRDAPQAEIVSAGQPRHAGDALAQAQKRAGDGEDVILLVDSLTRLAEATGDTGSAKEFFDAGRAQGDAGGGSLTVVAALERPESD
ncbi:MAG TPA: Rho termination factor N-terminal domain-containing protein [Solirubrobacterales bacterium]|nr:Rho termination factor N-terminal domain-containing protein [Solirubrobacterales bacterium]